jgi:hypothetical protein
LTLIAEEIRVAAVQLGALRSLMPRDGLKVWDDAWKAFKGGAKKYSPYAGAEAILCYGRAGNQTTKDTATYQGVERFKGFVDYAENYSQCIDPLGAFDD